MADFRVETDRLILRDWRDEDWPRFWEVTNTPAVMRWLGGVADAEKRRGAEERLRSYRREYGHTFWVCERRADGGHLSGELLGFCGLKRSNQKGGPIGVMEVGWRLREDAWGRGYAKEAAAASIAAGFERFGAGEIIALTVAANAASWGLMIRLGMRRREDLDFDSDEFDAETGRIIVYSIDRAAWALAQ